MKTPVSPEQVGFMLRKIADEQSEWSQATFGSDQERGPLGALRHLEKEAREAQQCPDDPTEYADCLLLIIDAARRAGFTIDELLRHTWDKLQVCKQREWPTPVPDQPVEHVRHDERSQQPK